MIRFSRAGAFFLLFAAAFVSHAQTAGAKVSSLDKGSEAAKAGIEVGDILERWQQGSESDVIQSPIEMDGIEIERGPRGPLQFFGTHQGKPKVWTVNAEYWGINEGPVWPEVQPVFDHMIELAKSKQFDAVPDYCRTACMSLDASSGARSFALWVAADLMGIANNMKGVDEFFSKALAECPKQRSYFFTQTYEKWSSIYQNHNDLASAEVYAQKALDESERLAPGSLTNAYYLLFLADVEKTRDNWQQTYRHCLEALRLRKSIAPRSIAVVGTLTAAGAAAKHSFQFAESRAYYEEALALALQVCPKEIVTGVVYNNLGDLAEIHGDLEAAEKYFFAGLDVAKTRDPDGELSAGLWGNLASILVARGNFAKAERCIAKAIAIEQKLGPAGEIRLATHLSNLADTKRLMGDNPGALVLVQRALAIKERLTPTAEDTAITLSVYAHVLREQKHFEEAKPVLLKAVSIMDAHSTQSLGAAMCRFSLGELYAETDQFKNAEQEIQIAAAIRGLLAPNSLDYAESLGALAHVQQRLGKTDLARSNYNKAIQLMDSQGAALARADSIHFRPPISDVYAELSSLYQSQGDSRHAFQLVDHSRAQTLVRSLTMENVNIRGSIPPALVEKDRKLESSLAELSEQRIRVMTEAHSKGLAEIDDKIANVTIEHDLTENQMRSANPRYAALTQLAAPALRQIQDLLGNDTLLLEYSLGFDHSYLYAVTHNRLISYPLPPRNQINLLAAQTHNFCIKPTWTPEAEKTSQQLSDIALGPVAELMKGQRRLLIVADGNLHYVPFGALPLPTMSGAPSGQRLAGTYEVVNLPSAALLVALRQHPAARAKDRDSIAIIGDPVFGKDDPRVTPGSKTPHNSLSASRGTDDDDDALSLEKDDATRGVKFKRLIHSREEAQAIASVTSKEHLVMALDFDANRTFALDPRVAQSRIVHFATHGVFDSKNPAMSGLVFSLVDKQGKSQAGFFGLDDIYRSHYSADLVVLSACDSALGEKLDGEGLVGLTWGFIYAGAKSVIASLWQVNDASTAELMEMFYTGIERRGLSPSAALREAQMTIAHRPEWSAPYYWAGFVIEGDYAK